MELSRIIYSLYIDIAQKNLVSHYESKEFFNRHYDWLLERQKKYADSLGVEYRHYVYDKSYIQYYNEFRNQYPQISEYNIVNFYKIHLLYELSKEYDEILYLDFDVTPVTSLNFFEEWDLSKGIAIFTGTAETQREINELETFSFKHSIRSPMAKYWNTKCMLIEKGINKKSQVFNTGIIGAHKNNLKKLDYFGDFNHMLQFMTDLTQDDFYPPTIKEMFGYDNETIWAYKTLSQNIEYQNLSSDWHHIMYKWNYIPSNTKFIHCINKNFEYVRGWCEKNNL